MRDARLILLCYSLSLATAPALAQLPQPAGERQAQSKPVARQVDGSGDRSGFLKAVLMRISPPQSGVKLLEELFQRVGSVPQVAMVKNLMQQQEAQKNMLKLAQAPNDLNLMIRPQAVGRQAVMPQPSLALLPRERKKTASMNHYSPAPPQAGIAGGGGGSDNFASATGAAGVAPAPPSVEVYMGNKPYPMSTDGQGSGRGLWTNSIGGDDRSTARSKATWYNAPREIQITDDRTVVRDYREALGASSPAASPSVDRGKLVNRSADGSVSAVYRAPSGTPAAAQAQPPDLATAASRLYKLSAALQHLQEGQVPGGANSMISSDEEERRSKTITTGYAAIDKREALRANVSVPNLQGASKGTIGGALAQEPSYGRSTLSGERRSQISKITTKSARKKSAKARNDRATLSDDLEEDALPGWRNTNRIAMSGSSIAALPPNVVIGIPLVRLGITETQANSALRAVGTTKQDTVDKWRVLSWKRNNNKTQTALQLYMRNGQLDAMRIFDPSLIATDFGVSMGDDVARVKEKFGEPAFILPEPGPGAGQNYIYPISQVGFQLSRGAPDQQPRVISVLIFNVK